MKAMSDINFPVTECPRQGGNKKRTCGIQQSCLQKRLYLRIRTIKLNVSTPARGFTLTLDTV
jgi:hypothetical protein